MRVIIIGVDGLIGKALHANLKRKAYDVLGTTRRGDDTAGGDRFFLDLSAPNLPSLPVTDVAIFCAAMSKFADCRNFPDLAHRVNVTGPLALATDIVERGGRVLTLSSSIVFDCLSPRANADRSPAPRCAYGRMMAEAEAGILALGGNVLRLTKIVTPESGRLVDWAGALKQGQQLRAFEDHRFCPMALEDAVESIAAVIEQPDGGIFQASGADDISYADAARHLADRLAIPRTRIEGTLAVDHGVPQNEITPFTSLDTSRLSALTGYRPPRAHDVIDKVLAGAFADIAAS